MKKKQNRHTDTPEVLNRDSEIGSGWVELFSSPVEFKSCHFEQALMNLFHEPEINSTVLLRADILQDRRSRYHDQDGVLLETPEVTDRKSKAHSLSHEPLFQNELSDEKILERNVDDIELRKVPTDLNFKPKVEIVRRLVPRNPYKDYISNQTCQILTLNDLDEADEESLLVVYVAHINTLEECPYYLPPVYAVGIFYKKSEKTLSVNYLPFEYKDSAALMAFKQLSSEERVIRIANRLLQTALKHSTGVMNGYEKRVQHDLVVSKTAFQNRYIALKKKYSQFLIDNWQESTNPKKHVFEDIAIAAFLIELWRDMYLEGEEFNFVDLGCGNGVLVYILISEGYRGVGIDARKRKSWKIFPENVSKSLREQAVIPLVLLRPHPVALQINPHVDDNGKVFQIPTKEFFDKNSNPVNGNLPVFAYYSSAALLKLPYVNSAEFSSNSFIIGNHSDELTLWIPLLGYPFMIIPCCSYAVSGKKARFTAKKEPNSPSSAYAGLVQHTEQLANLLGWKTQREMLRIPSTRNCAIIGQKTFTAQEIEEKKIRLLDVYSILMQEGGTEGWVEKAISLMNEPSRDH